MIYLKVNSRSTYQLSKNAEAGMRRGEARHHQKDIIFYYHFCLMLDNYPCTSYFVFVLYVYRFISIFIHTIYICIHIYIYIYKYIYIERYRLHCIVLIQFLSSFAWYRLRINTRQRHLSTPLTFSCRMKIGGSISNSRAKSHC